MAGGGRPGGCPRPPRPGAGPRGAGGHRRPPVLGLWDGAVGPAVARATAVERRDGGVLRVTAADPSWIRELERSAGLVRARLDTLLGTGVVRWLDIAQG